MLKPLSIETFPFYVEVLVKWNYIYGLAVLVITLCTLVILYHHSTFSLFWHRSSQNLHCFKKNILVNVEDK